MPTVPVVPSTFSHSWSLGYLSSLGVAMQSAPGRYGNDGCDFAPRSGGLTCLSARGRVTPCGAPSLLARIERRLDDFGFERLLADDDFHFRVRLGEGER